MGVENDDGSSPQSEPARIFLVLNPVAGYTLVRFSRQKIERHFASAGWDIRIYETTGHERLKDVVCEALDQGYRILAAAGGDGTISAVASALVNTSIPLAILPLGTGNILARELGIPLNFDRALRLITGAHSVHAVDGMQVGSGFYLANVGVGFSSLSIRNTLRQQKRVLGLSAYLWNIFLQLAGLRIDRFSLVVDGRPMKVRASEVFVANASVLGLQPFSPQAIIRPDDGLLNLCILRTRTALDFMRVAWTVLAVRQDPRPEFVSMKVQQKVSIRTRHPQLVEADGEIIGKTPLEVTLLPGAVQVIVPDRSGG